jgi:hypothetical protein
VNNLAMAAAQDFMPFGVTPWCDVIKFNLEDQGGGENLGLL